MSRRHAQKKSSEETHITSRAMFPRTHTLSEFYPQQPLMQVRAAIGVSGVASWSDTFFKHCMGEGGGWAARRTMTLPDSTRDKNAAISTWLFDKGKKLKTPVWSGTWTLRGKGIVKHGITQGNHVNTKTIQFLVPRSTKSNHSLLV